MGESSTDLKIAIERQHGGLATYRQTVPVVESFNGETVWQGEVQVFDLANHPSAVTAYAWSQAIDGSTKRRYVAVLNISPIDSPVAAVRAAIVAEYRGKK